MIKLLERFKSNEPMPDLSWEADVRLNLRRSEQRAWHVAYASLVCTGLCALILLMLVPLKRTVPYLVTVDKLTGEATVVPTGQATVERGWLLDKHWIKRFVLARERYDYPLLQTDYDTVQRMSGTEPWRAYERLFEGKDALDKKYGARLRIEPSVLSITLGEGNTATVRLETKTVQSPSDIVSMRRMIVTLRYEYRPTKQGKESDLIENPLGFVVIAYRADEELVSPQGDSK